MTTNFPRCEDGRVTLSTDNHGRDWEHFWVGDRYQFSNQIPNRLSFSTTNPGWILRDRGLCGWAGTPPPRHGVATTTTPPQPLTTAADGLPTQVGPSGGAGLLIVLGLIGAGVWAYYQRGGDDFADDYHPMSDVPGYPPLYTEADPSTHEDQFDSRETPPVRSDGTINGTHMGANSTPVAENGSPVADPWEVPAEDGTSNGEWPPKWMGAPFDPLQPEQPGEFEAYRQALEKDGLSPRGNDILKVIWGVTGGKSKKYQSARKRRDEFAKRLDYYRYESL